MCFDFQMGKWGLLENSATAFRCYFSPVTTAANGIKAWKILEDLTNHIDLVLTESSGSGSESGIQTQKSVKSKSDDESDNHTGSNDEDDNASTGLNVRDGSDNGSGTQLSKEVVHEIHLKLFLLLQINIE
ncbi:hypothetical protein ACLOJK_001579 [Asimina triloba]